MNRTEIKIKSLKDIDENEDLDYWAHQSYEAKLEALELIRLQYLKLKGWSGERANLTGFRRIFRISKRL